MAMSLISHLSDRTLPTKLGNVSFSDERERTDVISFSDLVQASSSDANYLSVSSGLVRQNTFTKEDSEVSAINEGRYQRAKMIGSAIVRRSQTESNFNLNDLRVKVISAMNYVRSNKF